jgi:heptosyltransferase-1
MRSILIVRPSAIGDIVMASPMIGALRKAYPRAHIAWVAEPSVVDLLRDNPDLDEVIRLPKARWKQLLKRGRFIAFANEVRRFAYTMRVRQYDIALDAQGLLRSRTIAWLSGARQRVGFDSREPGRFLMTRIISRGEDIKRIASEYCHLMQTLGVPTGDFPMNVCIGPGDRKASENTIRGAGISGTYAVICPFTTRPQKHWFEERWAELSSALRNELALAVVVLGGPADISGAGRIRTLSGGKIHDLTGAMSLGQSAAAIENASLVVGVDTGLTHMGVAFDRPTIALFGATCPYLYTPTANTIVLYNKLPCSPCRRRPTCNGEFTCMKSIEVKQVLATAKTLLQRKETAECTSCT